MEELFEFVSKGKKIKAGICVEGKFGPLVANREAEPGEEKIKTGILFFSSKYANNNN